MILLTVIDKTYEFTITTWVIWIHLDYLTRHESTYTAWQDMNPLTVIDMTWIH